MHQTRGQVSARPELTEVNHQRGQGNKSRHRQVDRVVQHLNMKCHLLGCVIDRGLVFRALL